MWTAESVKTFLIASNANPPKMPKYQSKELFVYELQKKETRLSYRNAYKEFSTIR